LPLTLAAALAAEAVLSTHHLASQQPHTETSVPEMPFVTTVSPITASGEQTAFDNEAFSPTMPWAHTWRGDRTDTYQLAEEEWVATPHKDSL
jgi:hypothetical protein